MNRKEVITYRLSQWWLGAQQAVACARALQIPFGSRTADGHALSLGTHRLLREPSIPALAKPQVLPGPEAVQLQLLLPPETLPHGTWVGRGCLHGRGGRGSVVQQQQFAAALATDAAPSAVDHRFVRANVAVVAAAARRRSGAVVEFAGVPAGWRDSIAAVAPCCPLVHRRLQAGSTAQRAMASVLCIACLPRSAVVIRIRPRSDAIGSICRRAETCISSERNMASWSRKPLSCHPGILTSYR